MSRFYPFMVWIFLAGTLMSFFRATIEDTSRAPHTLNILVCLGLLYWMNKGKK